ncbi:MAG: glycosyltransferase family 2 protein [Leptothrix sp. (in: b-proteobacteria)]
MSKIAANRHQPLVSVVIPAYNARQTLTETLASLAQQTYGSIEVIVVDDGSTDGTWELLQSTTLLPVRAVRQANAGLAAARNAGLKQARGDYIALLDADDLCTPDRLAVQVAYMEAQPELRLCCADFSAFNTGGVLAESYSASYYDAIGHASHGLQSLLPKREQLNLDVWLPAPLNQPVTTYRGQAYKALTHGNFVHPPTIMLRRSVLESVGMFEIEARSMCDWDWIVRVARSGQIGYIDRPLLRYRLSETQMSSGRHRVRAQLDIVHVAERILQRDSDLCQSEPTRYRQELGDHCLNAADALADTQPLQALRWLAYAAMRYGVVSASTGRVMVKSLLPSWLLNGVRHLRPSPPIKAPH